MPDQLLKFQRLAAEMWRKVMAVFPDPDRPETLLSRRYKPAWLWAMVPFVLIVLMVGAVVGLWVLYLT